MCRERPRYWDAIVISAEHHHHEEAVPVSLVAWGPAFRALSLSAHKLGNASAHDAHRNTWAYQLARSNTTPVVQSAGRARLRPPSGQRFWMCCDSPGRRHAYAVAPGALVHVHPPPPPSGEHVAPHPPFSQQPGVEGRGFSVGCGRATPLIGQPAQRLALHPLAPPARCWIPAASRSIGESARSRLRADVDTPPAHCKSPVSHRLTSRTSWRPSPGCSDHSTPP